MKAAGIAHTLFVLALASIFILACGFSWLGWKRMEYLSDLCTHRQDEYRELQRLAPKVHAHIEKEGRLPADEELFLMTQDRTIEASINGDISNYEVLATSGHDPNSAFEERKWSRMGFDGPYSHYASREDRITCHAW
jgi:hypothetical protein